MNDLDDKVVYCSNCLSLSIVIDKDSKCDVCTKCKCTITKESDINEWERLYKEKYPHSRVLHPRGIVDIEDFKINKYYN